MKSLFVVLWLAIIALIVLLGSCETVEIEKLIYDTVYVDKPRTSFVQTIHVDTVYKELLRVDTVEVTVVVKDTVLIVNNVETVRVDTVVQIKTDSIFIERVVEKIVNHYDTVIVERIITNVDTVYIDKIVHVTDTVYVTEYEQRVIYQSVEFVFPGRSTFYIADEFKGYYDDYNKAASDRNVLLNGGNVVITRVNPDNLPAEGWVSNFYYVQGDQAVIEISEQLPIEQCRAALYRELTRWQLKKKYSNDINRVMSPLFRTSPEPTVAEINTLFQ